MCGVTMPNGETAARLEDLARKEAFYKFKMNVLFSLRVWQIDKDVRGHCAPVTDWIKECVQELNGFINF